MSTYLARLGSVALGLSLSLGAATAQAEEGAFQIGIGSWVLSHESGSTELDVPGNPEIDTSETRWGLGNNAAWLEMGYGITDTLILGGILSVGNTSTEWDPEGPGSSEESRTEILIGPKLDYMFSPDATVRPFVGGVLALRSLSIENGGDSSSTGVLIGARGGLRIFVEDLVSIDPMLGLSFTAASGEIDPGSTDTNSTAFGIGLGVGLSLWLD